MSNVVTRISCWAFGHDLHPIAVSESDEVAVFRCRRCESWKTLDVICEPVGTERLKNRLRQAEEDKRAARKRGDETGVVYATGKESAFITAIEIMEGRAVDTERDRDD